MKSYIQYSLSILTFLFIILVLPLSLFFLTYLFKERKQELEQYKLTQVQTANSILKFIDHQFLNLTQSTYSIAQDELLTDSLKKYTHSNSLISDSVDLFERKKCISRLKNFLSLTPIATDIFVISKLDDTIITTQGWFTHENFYQTYFPNHNFFDQSQNNTPQLPLNLLTLCSDIFCSNLNCKNTFYLSCFLYTSNPTFDVIFAIDESSLFSYITPLTMGLFANQNISLHDSMLYDSSNKLSVCDYTFTSTYTNITYAFEFFPLHMPFFLDNLFISFIFICLLCFLGSLLLTISLANPSYRIYLKVCSSVDSNSKQVKFRLNHFFLLLENYINNILSSQTKLTTQLSSYRRLLNDTFLLNLLLTHDIETYLQELTDTCPWFNPSGYYSIILINSPDDLPQNILSDLNHSLNLLENQYPFEHHYMSILNRDITLLLVYSDLSSINTNLLLTSLKSQLPSIQISAGSIEQGILGIQTSYHQARKRQQQKLYNDTIIIEGYFYPINLELQLITSLKTGNKSKMEEILKLIFNQNNALCLNDAQQKKLYLVIFETFKRYAKDNNLNIDLFTHSFISHLHTNLAHVPSLLLELCDSLVTHTILQDCNHNKLLEQDILSYIASNFHDPNLCIDSITTKYQISRSSLQKIIKNNSAFTPTELINKFRVEKAISLIELNNCTITEISKAVGYDSYSTFKRIFIKTTGLSPSEYRQLHCSK